MSRPIDDGLHVYLGHGASGTAASMKAFVDGLAARGIAATAIDLPKRKAEDTVPVLREIVPNRPDVVVGGHSFGGRVASLAAAEDDARYAALVCFSFPLHRPGAPETAAARTGHLDRIRCPILFLSGEADQFARIGLLRETVARLPKARLVTYPAVRHGLNPVLDDALDQVATFLREVTGG